LTAAGSAKGTAPGAPSREGEDPQRWLTGDLALALAGALVALALSATLGFQKLAEPGLDNDSVMRLVQVRDLLSGQGWYDLHQYRMGPAGGFVMHWSRLVDAPVAGLILLFRPLVRGPGAELAAAIAWPTALLFVSLLAVLRGARALGGEAARLPALVLGTATFHFMAIFAPGSFDHHNVQLALVLTMSAWLIAGQSFNAGVVAGAAAGASMAVGMETIPYVAAAGAAVALRFWLRGEHEAPAASGFGIGFGAVAALSLILTVKPAAWFDTTCDALSGAHAGSAILAGLGLAAAATFAGGRSGAVRLGALAVLAAASAAFVFAVYPQCLADPYVEVPPRLRDYWLDWISEAQSLRSLLASEPATVATYYATPLVALGLAFGRLLRARGQDGSIAVAVILAAAVAVSVWQVRGSIFALALAVIPLSAWIGALRTQAAETPSVAATLKMAVAWLASVNVAWGLAGMLAFGAMTEMARERTSNACRTPSDFAALAGLPAGNVLTVTNHGAALLAYTSHRSLAGPYHRNIAGNLAMINAMVGTPEEALEIARSHDIAYVAVCPGNPETAILAQRAPEALLARIGRGETVDWLRPVPGSESATLRVFRVLGR
jgi:hypothetical protein